MMSQRRNSMHMPAAQMAPALSGSGHLPSGVLDTFSSLASDENRDAGVEVELAEDEEFAAEEHAHRFRVLLLQHHHLYCQAESVAVCWPEFLFWSAVCHLCTR